MYTCTSFKLVRCIQKKLLESKNWIKRPVSWKNSFLWNRGVLILMRVYTKFISPVFPVDYYYEKGEGGAGMRSQRFFPRRKEKERERRGEKEP